MASGNIYRRLLELLPDEPLLLATVSVQHGDGTVTVTFPGGGVQRVRDPLDSPLNEPVFIKAGAVAGPAPALPFTEIEI